MAPEGGAAFVVDAPADGRDVPIRDQIIAGVDFDAVVVEVAQIEKERVRQTVTARAALDLLHHAHAG